MENKILLTTRQATEKVLKNYLAPETSDDDILQCIKKMYECCGMTPPSDENIHIVDHPSELTKYINKNAKVTDCATKFKKLDDFSRKYQVEQTTINECSGLLKIFEYMIRGLIDIRTNYQFVAPVPHFLVEHFKREPDGNMITYMGTHTQMVAFELDQAIAIRKPVFKTRYVPEDEKRGETQGTYELFGDGEPAILFADGKGLYFIDGIELEEKYGKVPIKDWNPYWLVEEQNADLRSIFIRHIGFERCINELDAKLIDSYESNNDGIYELYNIPSKTKYQDFRLLKCICPSTGHIHVLRARPTDTSAENTITWINGGIHPNEFVLSA